MKNKNFWDSFHIESKKQSLESYADELKDTLDMLGEALDATNQGFVIVDQNGCIIRWHYEKLMGIKEKDVLGKKVDDVIENTRMHIVVKTGEKELYDVQKIQGRDMITSRIPIKRNNKVIGAVGIVLFKDPRDVKSLARKLELLENTFKKYKHEIIRIQSAKYSFDNIITQNKYMEYLKNTAKLASESNSTVLIQGESGTGKEFFAHAIHKASYRKAGPFVTINCAAIPHELLESELFGYEEGAFTGAKRRGKLGKFELANGGTILLDEIASMPLNMQAKLLRVLEERVLEKIGGNQSVPLNIRVIAATNEDLQEALTNGKFRQDLYYRLNVIRLYIPPLRERLDDIPILVKHLLKILTKEMNIEPKTISDEALLTMQGYSWPGNVRELRNALEGILNITRTDIIEAKDLPSYIIKNLPNKIHTLNKNKSLKEIVAEAELKAIKEAIKQAGGNKTEAAKLLGVHRTAIYKKIEAYGLDVNELE